MEIYLIKNKINKKTYIGKATNGFYNRYGNLWHKFICNKPIKKDLCVFDKDNFIVKIIGKAKTQKELCRLERFYIKKYNSIWPNGYNMQNGGMVGLKVHPETKKIISDKMKSSPLHNRGVFKKSKIVRCKTCEVEFRSYKCRGIFQKFCSIQCRGEGLKVKVLMFDKNLKLIKTYASLKDAAIDGFSPKRISGCINGRNKTHKGFVWRKHHDVTK